MQLPQKFGKCYLILQLIWNMCETGAVANHKLSVQRYNFQIKKNLQTQIP